MKRLMNNDQAIEFVMKDYLGENIDLSNYKGKKILLSFFRGASCPFCNLRIKKLIKRKAEFEDNQIEIITFFAATREEVNQYAGKQKAPFAIIPDPKMEIYKKYGIEKSHSGLLRSLVKPRIILGLLTTGLLNLKTIYEPLIPADFLIDESQVIHRAYYGKDYQDHLPIKDILGWKK